MKNEFLKGLKDGGNFVDKVFGPEKSSNATESETHTAKVHYRFSWVLYISPDCAIPPEREFLHSDFHIERQRIPQIFTDILKSEPFQKELLLEGLFPEPISAQEDLGYLVFADEDASRKFADELSKRLTKMFEEADPQLVYAEFELLKCFGLINAPSFIVQKEILLNSAFDSAGVSSDDGDTDQIIEIKSPIG